MADPDWLSGSSPVPNAPAQNVPDWLANSSAVPLRSVQPGGDVSLSEDLAKTIPTKLAEGATTKFAGAPGDMARMIGGIEGKLESWFPSLKARADANYAKMHPDEPDGPPSINEVGVPGYHPFANTSAGLQRSAEDALGTQFYEPKTNVGKIVGAAAENVTNPLSYAAPGSVFGNAAAAAASGAASEAAGQATKGTALEPYARLAAGVVAPAGQGLVTGARTMPEVFRATSAENPTTAFIERNASNRAVSDLADRVQGGNILLGEGTPQARSVPITPAAIAQKAQELGPNATAAEYTRALGNTAGAVAALPGAGSDVLTNAALIRGAARPQRVEDAVTQALGAPIDVFARNEAEAAARSNAATPLYEAWRNTAVPMTPELQALMPQLAESGAVRGARSDMAIENVAAANASFPKGRIDPNSPPSAEAWDYMKRNLDDKIEAAQRAGNNNRARQYTQLRNGIVDAIDNHPDPNVAGVWQQARQAYAQPTAILDARSAGQNVFKPSVSPNEFASQWRGMSVPEQQAHIEGARDALQQMLDSRNRSTAVENFLQAPANVQKLATMVGQDRADALATAMRQERAQAAHEVRVAGGSETASRMLGSQGLDNLPISNTVHEAIHTYAPDVTPLGLLQWTGIPQRLQKAESNYNKQVYRPDMARILSQTGPEAERVLRGLLDYRPANRLNTAVGRGAVGGLLSPSEGNQ